MAATLLKADKKSSVLITGGASGIGLAFAKRLVGLGHEVIVIGRRAEQLAVAKGQVPSLITLQGDVGDERSRIALADTIKASYPQVNVLVNNAGIQNRLPPLVVQSQSPESVDAAWQAHKAEISINLEAPIHLSMLLLPQLSSHPSSLIVNVTSGLSFVPIAFMPTYCATKAAAHSFTLSLRQQLKDTSVKVLEIVPPAVNTDLGGAGNHAMGENLDEFADAILAKVLESDDNVEVGFKMSEKVRNASRVELDGAFKGMNSGQH